MQEYDEAVLRCFLENQGQLFPEDVDVKDTYAAGDEQNDISMIEAAGTGIAMINGTDIVKKSADVITRFDNDHDGLAEFYLERSE